MRARVSTAALAEIAAICGLRRLATERDASRAALALGGAKDRLDERTSERSAAERDWHSAVSRPSLQLEMLQVSAFRLLQQEKAVAGAVADVERASADCARRVTDWLKALRQQDIVAELLRRATKLDASRREEASLWETLDRFAHRRESA